MLEQRYSLSQLPAWQELLYSLELADKGKFALFFLLVPDASGEPVCREALTRHLVVEDRHVLTLLSTTPEELSSLAVRLREISSAEGDVLWIAAQDAPTPEWQSAWRAALSRVNERRNQLFARTPIPIIICGTTMLRVLCRESAPDLWSVRAEVIEITVSSKPTTPRPPVDYTKPARLNIYGFTGDPTIPLEEADRLRAIPGRERGLIRNLIRGAEALLNRHQWEFAAGVLEEANPIAERYGSPQQRSQIAWMLGRSYNNLNRLMDAKDWLQRGKKLFQSAKEPLGVGDCIMGLGEIYIQQSELDEAERCYIEAKLIFQSAGNPLGEANSIKGLGDIHLRRSELDEAERSYIEAMSIYQRVEIKLGVANCILGLGEIRLRKFELDDAVHRFFDALIIFQSVGDLLGEANCIKILGDIHLYKSDLDQAERCFLEAISIFQRIGDPLGEGNCFKGLGDIHLRKSDLDQAERCYLDAVSIFKNAGIKNGLANSTYRLGEIKFRVRAWEQAHEYYQNALSIYLSLGETYGVMNVSERLALLAWNQGQQESAKAQLLEVHRRWEELQLPEPLAYINYVLSCFPDTKETQIAYRRKAEQLAKEHLDAQLWETMLKDIEMLLPEGTVVREL